MLVNKQESALEANPTLIKSLTVWFSVAALVYLLLLSVGMIGSGFKWATAGHAQQLFDFASNPFLGLLIGTLATALIQSSSTVTSIIVGLVAGGLPVETAIPMIMGANIGTTITNTLVSLGHIKSSDEFKRAFAAATVHDFFNLIAVIIFLPLEIIFGFLEKFSGYLASHLMGTETMSIKGFDFIKPVTKPIINFFKDLLHAVPEPWGGVILILIGIVCIFIAISFIGKQLKRVMVGRAKQILHNAIGRGPMSGLTSGTVVTVLVQSSSTTTSLIVPLVGSGIFTVRDIYPFTLGANIGTCITALLAATAVSGGNSVFALQIALVHLCYNICGVIIIYGLPFLRNIPIIASEKLAEVSTRHKAVAAFYIISVFFLVPGICIYISQ